MPKDPKAFSFHLTWIYVLIKNSNELEFPIQQYQSKFSFHSISFQFLDFVEKRKPHESFSISFFCIKRTFDKSLRPYLVRCYLTMTSTHLGTFLCMLQQIKFKFINWMLLISWLTYFWSYKNIFTSSYSGRQHKKNNINKKIFDFFL